jgi:hypothetical protein
MYTCCLSARLICKEEKKQRADQDSLGNPRDDALLLCSGSRLDVVVEDGLCDNDILALTEVVNDLVLGLILLHAGEALTGSEAGLLLVLETLQPFEFALVLIVSVWVCLLVLGVLLVMFPMRDGFYLFYIIFESGKSHLYTIFLFFPCRDTKTYTQTHAFGQEIVRELTCGRRERSGRGRGHAFRQPWLLQKQQAKGAQRGVCKYNGSYFYFFFFIFFGGNTNKRTKNKENNTNKTRIEINSSITGSSTAGFVVEFRVHSWLLLLLLLLSL